jgi:AraC-like DNA-binding protein
MAQGRTSPAILQRAAQVFDFTEHDADSPLVEKVWATRSAPQPAFISVAESHWQFVVTVHEGQSHMVAQGPNDRARVTPIPEEAEFFGVVLPLGTFMPTVSLSNHLGTAHPLPAAGDRTVWLAGSRWELPTLDNADVFVERLVRAEVLVRDMTVGRMQVDEQLGHSLRTTQRRVRRATGLTLAVIQQIHRAHAAVDALGNGAQPSDVAARLGYADQPHLTRSLQRFVGQTPARVVNTGGHWSASSPLGGAHAAP